MNKPEVLIIDDEPALRSLLEMTLLRNGFAVASAASARAGLIRAANHPPAAILLDLGLPDRSGQDVLRELRQWYTAPVIILSVQRSEDEIIQALDNGANDYLTKPFRTGELLARIRAALRQAVGDEARSLLGDEQLQIDLMARLVRKQGQVVKLTTTEYQLLALMARNEGKVLTHAFLLRAIWGPGFIHQSQYLRVYIAQLRKKLEDDPNQPRYLLTESGVGYRLLLD